MDEDTRVIKRLLGLKEPLGILCPVLLTQSLIDRILRGEAFGVADRIQDAYHKVAVDKDVVVLEGANNLAAGCIVDMCGIEIINAFQAKSVVVVRYRADLVVDHLLIAKRVVGEPVIGAVINTVPPGRLGYVETAVAPFCEKRGVHIFASLPQDRLLMATAVGEIAETIAGEVLCAQDHLDDLVEHVMVGAMTVDSALQYFRRKANKVVITGGDRTDLISAALDTSTACIVLTGNLHPGAVILARAEEQGVPIILSRHDTMVTVDLINRCFGKVRFHDQTKLLRFESLLDERFDYAGLYAALGLTGK